MIHSADLKSITRDNSPIKPISGAGSASGRKNPAGTEIGADRYSLLRGGRHWMPVMGEMQYSRCARSSWRDALITMKAGGIEIVATYVFWIHHEEIEGEFDFTGQRNLRDFVLLCQELGLYVQARIGPWDHGECRNGGFPDWLMRQGYNAEVPAESEGKVSKIGTGYALRSDDPGYLAKVKALYGQIAIQLKGLLWKDGGPVIGIQLENEYPGPAEHLLTLKRMASEAGLEVPLYCRTGWPALKTPMPFGEMLPLFGVYAEGFWDRNVEIMPGGYWEGFAFKGQRADATIATDHFGIRKEKDESNVERYPYLTCELGGFMITSYHRRIHLFPKDIAAPAMIRLGAGNSLPGYYVYRGGTNPDGKLSTLNESQATGYPNDLPVKSYDGQAIVGEFGQIRPHYHLMRHSSLFIQDYGELLSTMPSVFPAPYPKGKEDTKTLRWCVRTDGNGAFLFLNNYQRLQPMPAKPQIQFSLSFKDEEITLPSEPATMPADYFFCWPVRVDIGGVNLVYATAEIYCRLDAGEIQYVLFKETSGVPAEFVFREDVEVTSTGTVTRSGGRTRVSRLSPGLDVAIRIRTASGWVHLILLDHETSLSCWRLKIGERSHIVLSPFLPLPDDNKLRCQLTDASEQTIAFLPQPKTVQTNGISLEPKVDGAFARYTLPAHRNPPGKVSLEQIKKAGPARKVPIGPFGVAEAPSDQDFEEAAVWRVKVTDPEKLLLNFHYVGDVARIYLNGRLLTDNFYNGRPLEFGFDYYLPEIKEGELLLKTLPLRKDAPIYLRPADWPANLTESGVAEIKKVEAIRTTEIALALP